MLLLFVEAGPAVRIDADDRGKPVSQHVDARRPR
jgi:hypothetical protein